MHWINMQGPEVLRVCGTIGAHRYCRQDRRAVAAINSFIRSR
jgi:hypothetical protein